MTIKTEGLILMEVLQRIERKRSTEEVVNDIQDNVNLLMELNYEMKESNREIRNILDVLLENQLAFQESLNEVRERVQKYE